MSITYPDLPFTTFPDSIQSFVTMLNMTVEDAEYVKGYQEAVLNNDTASQIYFYSKIVDAPQKFIDSGKINTLMQTCMALERFYGTEIEPFIEEKEANWENRVNQFNYTGTFSNSKQYEINNFVSYNLSGTDRIYICTSRPPVGTLPTNTTYWRELSIQGKQGVSGEGLSFRYAWDSSQSYSLSDTVTYNNSVWIATQASSNKAPSPTSSYWRLIYTPSQNIYPFQKETPTLGLNVGYLWFENISE